MAGRSRNSKPWVEIAEIYESMTLAQVNEAIAAFPLDKNMTVVVGPKENLEPA